MDRSRSTGFLPGLFATYGVVTAIILMSATYSLSDRKIPARDVRSACVGHQGVHSTRSVEWTMAQNGSLAITCRDGYFTTR